MVKSLCVRGRGRGLAVVGVGASLAAGAGLCAAPARARRAAVRAQVPSSLHSSPALWATIDVCNPPDQRYTIGIRGSMPSDGQRHDTMFMRFRLQRMNTVSHRWVDVPGAASAFLAMGSSLSGAEAGRSFTLVRPAGPAFVLRGAVNFQWRRGAKVLATLSRATKSGHVSQTGADPPKFSAATCRIG